MEVIFHGSLKINSIKSRTKVARAEPITQELPAGKERLFFYAGKKSGLVQAGVFVIA